MMENNAFIEKLLIRRNSILIVVGFILSFALLQNNWFGYGYVEKNFNIQIIEMSIYNSPRTIFYHLHTLGYDGRMHYVLLQFIDYMFITNFFLFVCLVISKLLKVLGREKKFKYTLVFALLRSIMDYIENTTMIINIFIYPKVNGVLLTISSVTITLKWIFNIGIGVILLGLLILWVTNKMKTKNRERE